jgi:hypothetical protein
MTKRDVISLALIIVGISIISNVLINVATRLIMFPLEFYTANDSYWIFIIVLALILIGLFIILKAASISKIIVKQENNDKIEFSLTKTDTIQVSIIVLCLYFLVSLFPSTIDDISQLVSIIFQYRTNMNEFIPKHILSIVLYLIVIISLVKSRKVTMWIENKIK